MKRTHRVSLLAAALACATPVHAEDVCTQVVVYAWRQVCNLLPSGHSLCQPVALTGPSPACERPPEASHTVIPLAPPTLYAPAAGYTPKPFVPYTPLAAQIWGGGQAPTTQAAAAPAVAAPVKPAATATAPVSASPVSAPHVSAPHNLTAPAAADAVPAAAAQPAAPMPLPATRAAPAHLAPETPALPALLAVQQATAAATPANVPSPAAPTVSATPATLATTVEAVPSPTRIIDPSMVRQVVTTASLPAVAQRAQPSAIQDALAHFPFDSAELTASGRAALDDWFTQATPGISILVTGHADRLGPEPYNDKLSQRRAEAVRAYLQQKGKPTREIGILAKGEKAPVKRCKGGASELTKACLAPNRRVEIKTRSPGAK